MAEFLADLLAYGAPGFFQGFQAANEYRRQKALAEFNMKMKMEDLQLRRAAEARLAEQTRQNAEFHRAQMDSFAAQAEDRKAQAEQRRMEGLMKPIDPQDALVNDLSMAARARARAAAAAMGTASHEPVALPEGQIGPPEASPYDRAQAEYQGAAEEIGGVAREEVARRDRIAKQLADARTTQANKPPAGRDTRPTPKQGADVANLDLASKMLDDIDQKVRANPSSTGIGAGLRTSKVARLTGVGLDQKALDTKTYVEQQLNTMVLRLAGTTFSDRYLARLKDQMVDIWESNSAFNTKLQAMKGIIREWRDSMVQGVEYSGRDTSLMRSNGPAADASSMSVPEALSEFAGFEVH